MGLFRRGKRAAGPPAIVVDPCGYDPEAPRLRAALQQREWKTARDFLDAVTDPDDRAFYLSICADVSGVQDWIEEWIAAEPDSTLPLLVRGAHAVHWAWEARGREAGENTSREQFRGFHQRLKLAENCLDEVVERDPDEVSAWAFLVMSARGRGVERAEAQRRFDAVVRLHPRHLAAHRQMLQYLCRKWCGSHEEMLAFARTSLEAAPAGTPLGVLVANAHIEQWVELDTDAEVEEYFGRPEVAAELNAAADRSIRHPDYRPRPGWPEVHNSFAMAFALAGDARSAIEQFELIGDRATDFPWRYWGGGSGQDFQRLRAEAYAKVGG